MVWFCTREEPIVYLGDMPFVLRDAAREFSVFLRWEEEE